MEVPTSPGIKIIGANGQISLGKQFAGLQVLVEEQEARCLVDTHRYRHSGQ
ncbi:MAG: hypothetical protein ACRESZ_12180 [Methylococcales bacterium]